MLCMSFGAGAPLLRALSFMSTLPQINYKITALEQLMNAPALEQKEKPFTGKDHSISFENVRFAYKEDEVLHGVSFTVPESSLTALVGESGSGKSTLAKLLVHYYDVTGGSIKVGGQDLRYMSVEALNDEKMCIRDSLTTVFHTVDLQISGIIACRNREANTHRAVGGHFIAVRIQEFHIIKLKFFAHVAQGGNGRIVIRALCDFRNHDLHALIKYAFIGIHLYAGLGICEIHSRGLLHRFFRFEIFFVGCFQAGPCLLYTSNQTGYD